VKDFVAAMVAILVACIGIPIAIMFIYAVVQWMILPLLEIFGALVGWVV